MPCQSRRASPSACLTDDGTRVLYNRKRLKLSASMAGRSAASPNGSGSSLRSLPAGRRYSSSRSSRRKPACWAASSIGLSSARRRSSLSAPLRPRVTLSPSSASTEANSFPRAIWSRSISQLPWPLRLRAETTPRAMPRLERTQVCRPFLPGNHSPTSDANGKERDTPDASVSPLQGQVGRDSGLQDQQADQVRRIKRSRHPVLSRAPLPDAEDRHEIWSLG